MAYYIPQQVQYGKPIPPSQLNTIPYKPQQDYKPQLPGGGAIPQPSAPAPAPPSALPPPAVTPLVAAAAPAVPPTPPAQAPTPAAPPSSAPPPPLQGLQAARGSMGMEVMGGSGGGLDVATAEGAPETRGLAGGEARGQAILRQGIGTRIVPEDMGALAGLRRVY